jgi:hypothetical protein
MRTFALIIATLALLAAFTMSLEITSGRFGVAIGDLESRCTSEECRRSAGKRYFGTNNDKFHRNAGVLLARGEDVLQVLPAGKGEGHHDATAQRRGGVDDTALSDVRLPAFGGSARDGVPTELRGPVIPSCPGFDPSAGIIKDPGQYCKPPH